MVQRIRLCQPSKAQTESCERADIFNYWRLTSSFDSKELIAQEKCINTSKNEARKPLSFLPRFRIFAQRFLLCFQQKPVRAFEAVDRCEENDQSLGHDHPSRSGGQRLTKPKRASSRSERGVASGNNFETSVQRE
uniref:Uncharacterized protein n=1 Tax=Cyanoptyche gloeocystis TaxID=77922 RepID=A0A7S2JMZ4_9EUKA